MKWPWKRPVPEVEHLKRRADDAAAYVKRAENINNARRDEVRETSSWLKSRREENHLTELFWQARGGRP